MPHPTSTSIEDEDELQLAAKALRFCPTVQFHQDEKFYPCSIEHMLQGGQLKAHRAVRIGDQQIMGLDNHVALADFKGRLWMAYPSGGKIIISSSADGFTEWGSNSALAGIASAHESPALVVHDNLLWMIFTHQEKIFVTNSEDGLHWRASWSIEGLLARNPTLTRCNGALWLAYSDAESQLWIATSKDGRKWQQWKIADQRSKAPVIAALNGKLWIVYSESNNSQLWVTGSADGKQWECKRIPRQHSSIPSLTAFNGALWMVYSGATDSSMWVSQSKDGWNWDAKSIPDQSTSIPTVTTYNNRLCMAYPDAVPENNWLPPQTMKFQLWASQSSDGWTWQRPSVSNPSQASLAAETGSEYYLVVNEGQYPGQPVGNAPLYYAVQVFESYTELTYIFLYAYNGSQTVRVPFNGTDNFCILKDFARHQGDLEVFKVRITNDLDPAIIRVIFESHGDAKEYGPDEVAYSTKNTSSVLVHVSLNLHGTFNFKATGTWIISSQVTNIVDIGDAIGPGQVWVPNDLRFVGLDSGQPVGNEVWVKFGGRLGEPCKNELTSGTYFNGSNLNHLLWNHIKVLEIFASPPKTGDGPKGLRDRSYIRRIEPQRLVVMHNGRDDLGAGKLWRKPADLERWLPDAEVPNVGITETPAPVMYRGLLYVFHQGGSANGELWVNVWNGSRWSGDKRIQNVIMSESPSAVVFNDKLYVFYQGGGQSGQLWYVAFDGATWSQQDTRIAGVAGSCSPSAVVYSGLLYLFYQGFPFNGALWYTTFDGTVWQTDRPVTNVGISHSPAAVAFEGNLYVFHQGSANCGQMRYIVFNGLDWGPLVRFTDAFIIASPSTVVLNNQLYLFHQGATGGQLWWSAFNGRSWQKHTNVEGLKLTHSPAAVLDRSGLFVGRA